MYEFNIYAHFTVQFQIHSLYQIFNLIETLIY